MYNNREVWKNVDLNGKGSDVTFDVLLSPVWAVMRFTHDYLHLLWKGEKRELFFCTLLWDPISRRLGIISKKFRALVYNKRYFDHGNLSDYGYDTDDNNIIILVISIHASPLGTFCGQFTLWQEVNQHSFCNHEPTQGLLWYFPFVSLLECCLFILGCVQVWVLFHRGSVLQWQTWSTFKGLQQVSTFSLACHVFIVD